MAKETEDKDHLVNAPKDKGKMPSEEIGGPSQTEKDPDDDLILPSQNSTADQNESGESEQSQILVDIVPPNTNIPPSVVSSASNSVISDLESNHSQNEEYGYDDDVPFSYYAPLQTKERTAPLIDHHKSKSEKRKEKKERKKEIKKERQEVQQNRLMEKQKEQEDKEMESKLTKAEPGEFESKVPRAETTGVDSKVLETESNETESKVPMAETSETESKLPQAEQPSETESNLPKPERTKTAETTGVDSKAMEAESNETESKVPKAETSETESKLPKAEPSEPESKLPKPERTKTESKSTKDEHFVHDYNLSTTMAGLAMTVSKHHVDTNPNFLYHDGEIELGDHDDDDDDEEFSVEGLESIKIAKSKRVSMRASVNQNQNQNDASKKKSGSNSPKKKSKKKRGRRADYEEPDEGGNGDNIEAENGANPSASSKKDVAARVEAIFTNKELILKDFDGYIEKWDAEKKELDKMLEEQHRGRGKSASRNKHRGRSRSSSKPPRLVRSHSAGATPMDGRNRVLKRGRRPNKPKALAPKQSPNDNPDSMRTPSQPPENRRSSLMSGRSKSDYLAKHIKGESRQNRKKRGGNDPPGVCQQRERREKPGQLSLDDRTDRPLSRTQPTRKRSGSFSELEDRIHAGNDSADYNKIGTKKSSKKLQQSLSEEVTGSKDTESSNEKTKAKSRERNREKLDRLKLDDRRERPLSKTRPTRKRSGSFSELEDQIHINKDSADHNKTGTKKSSKKVQQLPSEEVTEKRKAKSRERNREKPDRLKLDDKRERPLSKTRPTRKRSGSFSELEDQIHINKNSADPNKTGTKKSSKKVQQSPSNEVTGGKHVGSSNEKTKAQSRERKEKADRLKLDDRRERPLSKTRPTRKRSGSFSELEDQIHINKDSADPNKIGAKKSSKKTPQAPPEEATGSSNEKTKAKSRDRQEKPGQLTLDGKEEKPFSKTRPTRQRSGSFSELEDQIHAGNDSADPNKTEAMSLSKKTPQSPSEELTGSADEETKAKHPAKKREKGGKEKIETLTQDDSVDKPMRRHSSSDSELEGIKSETSGLSEDQTRADKSKVSAKTIQSLFKDLVGKSSSKSTQKGKKEESDNLALDSIDRSPSLSQDLRRKSSSNSDLEDQKATDGESNHSSKNETMKVSKTLLALSEEVAGKLSSKMKSAKKGKEEDEQQPELTLKDSVERPLLVSKGMRRRSNSDSEVEGVKAKIESQSQLSDDGPTTISRAKENRQKDSKGLSQSEHGIAKKTAATTKKKGSKSKEILDDSLNYRSLEGKHAKGLSQSEREIAKAAKKKGSKPKEVSHDSEEEKVVADNKVPENQQKHTKELSVKEHGAKQRKSKPKEDPNHLDDEKSLEDFEVPLAPSADNRQKERALFPAGGGSGSPNEMEMTTTDLIRSASLTADHEAMKGDSKTKADSPSSNISGHKKIGTKGTERKRSKSPRGKNKPVKSPSRKPKARGLDATSTHGLKDKKTKSNLDTNSSHSIKEKMMLSRTRSKELGKVIKSSSENAKEESDNPDENTSKETPGKEKHRKEIDESATLDLLFDSEFESSEEEFDHIRPSLSSISSNKKKTSDMDATSSHSRKGRKKKKGDLDANSNHGIKNKQSRTRSKERSKKVKSSSGNAKKERDILDENKSKGEDVDDSEKLELLLDSDVEPSVEDYEHIRTSLSSISSSHSRKGKKKKKGNLDAGSNHSIKEKKKLSTTRSKELGKKVKSRLGNAKNKTKEASGQEIDDSERLDLLLDSDFEPSVEDYEHIRTSLTSISSSHSRKGKKKKKGNLDVGGSNHSIKEKKKLSTTRSKELGKKVIRTSEHTKKELGEEIDDGAALDLLFDSDVESSEEEYDTIPASFSSLSSSVTNKRTSCTESSSTLKSKSKKKSHK